MFIYVVSAVMIFTIAAIVTTTLREKHRRQQLADAALKFGFSFEGDGQNLFAAGLANLPLFVISQLPRHSETRNVFRKHLTEADLFICDYHYWTGGNGNNRFDHDQTVACFLLARPILPEFTLNQRPSNREREMARMGLRMAGLSARISSSSFRHALETMVGSLEDEGIQSNAHPKFNQTYCLTSAEHTDETRALFGGELIGLLETQAPPLCIQSGGRWLIIYRKDVKAKPDDFGAFSGEVERVFRILLKANEGGKKT